MPTATPTWRKSKYKIPKYNADEIKPGYFSTLKLNDWQEA